MCWEKEYFDIDSDIFTDAFGNSPIDHDLEHDENFCFPSSPSLSEDFMAEEEPLNKQQINDTSFFASSEDNLPVSFFFLLLLLFISDNSAQFFCQNKIKFELKNF